MKDVKSILQTLISASEQVPGVEADPEEVLFALETMMDGRKQAFESLREAVSAGAEITDEMRAEAKRLGELDRAWSARAAAAMQTLSTRLAACRKLRAASHALRPVPTAHLQI